MKHWHVIRFLLLACAMSVSLPLYAQGSSSAQAQAQAQKDYGKAQKLFDQGKFGDALELFREVYKVTESPNARMWIGNCLVSLGRNAEAYEEMTAAMKDASKRAQKEPKYAKTRDSAGAELSRLEQKVGKVVVVVVGAAPSKATLNGEEFSVERLGIPVAVEPGATKVEVAQADGTVAKGDAQIGAGETKTITISFAAGKEAGGGGGGGTGAGTEPKDSTSGPQGKSGGGLRIAGFVITGLGVAGLGAFGVAGVLAKGELDKLETECSGQRCSDPKYGDVVDKGKSYALVANIGLFAGIACVTAGIPMIIFGGASESKSKLGGAALDISPTGMGFSYRGTF